MHSKKQTLCIVRNTHRATSYTQCVFVNKTTLCKIPIPLIFTNKIRFIFFIERGYLISINHSVIPNSIRNLITKYSVDAETSSA